MIKIERSKLAKYFIGILGLWLCAATYVYAQARGGGAGGRGGGGGGVGANRGGGSTSGSATQQYSPNGTIGDAVISSDPETRRLIVITDDETSQYVSQVITNLDRPKPQVLIKVVFLEVTYRNTLDIGIEGGAAHNLDGSRGAGASFFGLSGLGSSSTGQVLNA